MTTLSSGDVLELVGHIGITAKLFRGWCEQGRVPMDEEADGPGSQRRFTVQQAVAIVIAAQVYRSERGCSPEYVSKVIEAFAAVDRRWFLGQFANGNRYLIGVRDGLPVLGPKLALDEAQRVNVWLAYGQTLGKVEEIEKRLHARPSAGRVRGLAQK